MDTPDPVEAPTTEPTDTPAAAEPTVAPMAAVEPAPEATPEPESEPVPEKEPEPDQQPENPAPIVQQAEELQPEPVPLVVPAAVVNGVVYRGRDDNDVLTGSFCRVVSGPYEGRYAVYINTATVGPDGYPVDVVVRTRDANDELLNVKYADIRPAEAGGR